MDILDRIDFKKMDPKGMIEHIESFPKLVEDAIELSESYSLPPYYIKAKKIVITGMGGSGAAGDIVKSLLLGQKGLVVESIHGYDLPGYVDNDTLVIANSYSGNTEETLTGFLNAYNLGAKLIAISTGGKLKILAEKYKAPLFLFDYDCPPRASFPYNFILLLSIFIKLGYLEKSILDGISDLLFPYLEKYGSKTSVFANPAKILAQKLQGKIPVFYTSEKLIGAAKRFKNQINENSKNFSFYEELPELDHNSIEGLANGKEHVFILSLESNFEFERNILRQNIGQDLLLKNRVSIERIKFPNCLNLLQESLLITMLGDFVSYYLGLLNKGNPGTNDTVDFLKSRL